MPNLSLQSFTALVERQAAAAQAACSRLLDFSVGSILRALTEATASVALWLQWLIVLVLKATRLSTSEGADADSFCADFGLPRAGAVAAVGQVTFSRFSAGAAALVPLGTQVKTADGSLVFQVTGDAAHPDWNPALGGYQIGPAVASITVPVACTVAGTVGNVQSGAISLVASAVPGLDAVTNELPCQGGADPESDAALRERFRNFIDTRSRATVGAVAYAIGSAQANILFSIAENQDTSGAVRPGSFVVTIDDGTGSPPDSLIAAVYEAVDAVRPVGSTFAVRRPTILLADISLTVTVRPGYAGGDVAAAVHDAIASFVDALPIGAALPYGRLFQIAYNVPGVAGVSLLLLNGGMADVGGAPGAAVRAGTIVVS